MLGRLHGPGDYHNQLPATAPVDTARYVAILRRRCIGCERLPIVVTAKLENCVTMAKPNASRANNAVTPTDRSIPGRVNDAASSAGGVGGKRGQSQIDSDKMRKENNLSI